MRSIRHFVLVLGLFVTGAAAEPSASLFNTPPYDAHPETYFHLIGGNADKEQLTVDLEAVANAGIRGIQLFHGKGDAWPGISPQITCLSSSWDDLIAHIGNETRRLNLRFMMHNCPGWATAGGPWIKPDNAMRHIIWSRKDVAGGESIVVDVEQPQPSQESWRDYCDIATLAFPTPANDTGGYLMPARVVSNDRNIPWEDLLAGKAVNQAYLNPGDNPVWVEVYFDQPTVLRTLLLPPVETLMRRRFFDPDCVVRVEAITDQGLIETGRRPIPRSNWQDKQPGIGLSLSFPDRSAHGFRITFENRHSMELTRFQLSSAARINDWRGQAGFVLRSLERGAVPDQDPAAWVDPDAVVDLTGRSTWNAPAGNWTLVRFGHVNTGTKNKPAPPEATGFECDKLSPLGAEQHFAGYIGRLCGPEGPVNGTLHSMLLDSWECYTQTWTETMEREFESRRGYPLRTWLPALAGWVMKDHVTSERFLCDWRRTLSDLLVDNYFGRLSELGREQGLEVSFETACGDVTPGDILQYYSKADLLMCEFWQPNDPHWGGSEVKKIKPTTSAAHIYGKPVIAAEAFTNNRLRWDEHPFALMYLANRNFALGVNHMVLHTYTHNPHKDVVPGTSFGRRIGAPFLRGQTWWKHMPLFTDYMARCGYMLRQGRPVADVLWYLGDDFDHAPREDTPSPDGYKFDYLNQDALTHRIAVEEGLLRTPEGTSWKILYLPKGACHRLTPETLRKLKSLLQAGATVVGEAPELNPSLAGGSIDKLVRELWGEKPGAAGDRRIGKGRLLWGDDLESIMSDLGLEPDVQGTQSATWCHRSTPEMEIYFIAAGRIDPLDANLSFRAAGVPEFWDPMTGTVSPVPVYQRKNGRTRIPMDLPAAGSTFVVFRGENRAAPVTRIELDGKPVVDAADPDKVDRGEPYPNLGLQPGEVLQPWVDPAPVKCAVRDGRLVAWKNGTYTVTGGDGQTSSFSIRGARSMALDSGWWLSFPPGWDAPDRIDLTRVIPWSDLRNPAVRSFSGTATYGVRVKLPEYAADECLMLDLGRVENIAEISVNGDEVATLWAPPFRADITEYVKKGANNIEIKVTNTWYNRLLYDVALPVDQQKTWTYAHPAADKPLIKAGLEGPVALHVGKLRDL